MTGKFITLEGIDGAGKSTHLPFVTRLIRDFLQPWQKRVVTTREPGGTWLGERLRDLLLQQPMQIETEALLMFAARNEHLAQVIEPALAQGDWVVSDRFTDASFAYQGGGRGLAIDKLEKLEAWVHPNRQPDLTLLFDISPQIAQQRLQSARALDKFEQETPGFFAATRAEYLCRAQQFPKRFCVLDATLPLAQVELHVRAAILNFTHSFIHEFPLP